MAKRAELIVYEDIERAAATGDISTVCQAVAQQSPEILTGLLLGIHPMLGKGIQLIHAGWKGAFFLQIAKELEQLRKSGAIKEGYLSSDAAKACFADLLDYIDKISPDPKRYEAMRFAFFKIMRGGETGKNAPYRQQLLRIVSGLSSGEILVLAATYKLGYGGEKPVTVWRGEVAEASGLLRAEIVAGFETTLIDKHLVLPPVDIVDTTRRSDHCQWGVRNRLTLLGADVCAEIQTEPI